MQRGHADEGAGRNQVGDLVLGLWTPRRRAHRAWGAALGDRTAAARGREPIQRPSGARLHRRVAASLRAGPQRGWLLLSAILLVGSVSTTVFVVSEHMDPIDALYFTATTWPLAGYGDINLLEAPDWLKVYDIGLMAASAVLLPRSSPS